MRKKLAFEIFISGVVVFDALGWEWKHLPVWPFLPMWVGAMLEIEVGVRVLERLSRLLGRHQVAQPTSARYQARIPSHLPESVGG